MKHTFFVSLFTALSVVLFSQNIERKIIIKSGNFYFTTIDDETQIATLVSGNDTSSIKTARKFALPAGRNFTDPINPFCWDVLNNQVYAVNFLMHSLNDRNEAIKRYSLSSLKEWGPDIKPMEMIMISVDATPYAYNDPYLFVTRRSNTLSQFFFDAIAINDTSYCMVIANNGELSVWIFNGQEWKHSDVFDFPVGGYFSLFVIKNDVYLVTTEGEIHKVSLKGLSAMKNKNLSSNLQSGVLIINKDEDSVWYLKNGDINQHSPINKLIKNKAKRIY